MDLVDEEDVALLERGEDRGEVALALERRPGDRADPDAELLADDVREARLAEPGRADEQDVVERLAPRLRRVERDRELLLHPLLADEVVEPARPQRAVELVLVLAQEPARGTCARHAAFLSASAHALLGRQLGIDPGERALGVEQRVAELDERVARDEVAARRPDGAGSTAPSFSFSSSTTRCAVFLPIPGIASKRAVSSSAIARRSSAGRRAGDDRERDLRARRR